MSTATTSPTRPLPSRAMMARYVAFLVLKAIHEGTYADVALDRGLRQHPNLSTADRRLVTELVYGCARQQGQLDQWIDRLATKPASKQPPDVRTILHLGLYQLSALDRVPPSAAVHTSVELAKYCGFQGLTGFINGLLRSYIRQKPAEPPLTNRFAEPGSADDRPDNNLPGQTVADRLGAAYSYPAWIVQTWIDRLGVSEAEQLCQWFDQPPSLDLRVNQLVATVEDVETAFLAVGILVERVPLIPGALRLSQAERRAAGGAIEDLAERLDQDTPAATGRSWIERLPGYAEGWWTIQDASAQLAALLLDPQPLETVIDACAAPGGKTTHIAELMKDSGQVWAIDRAASRLKRLSQNVQRLGLQAVRVVAADFTGQDTPRPDRSGQKKSLVQRLVASRSTLDQLPHPIDRLLLDVPCSGLGTLHRRADARWRQTPDSVRSLTDLQAALLDEANNWVKPGGVAVYATCTIHEPENGAMIRQFLDRHPNWSIEPPPADSPLQAFTQPEGWLEVWPHRWHMDGFFMVRLRRQN